MPIGRGQSMLGISWLSPQMTGSLRLRTPNAAYASRQPVHRPLLRPPPVPHVQFAEHRHGRREVPRRIVLLARAPAELAEAEVAVGHKRAHPELGREGNALVVVLLRA